MANTNGQELARDLGIVASARVAAMTLIELLSIIGPELQKGRFSPLGSWLGVSRFDERQSK